MPQYPWSGLPPSDAPETSTSIRVDATHPWDFFWGKSMQDTPQLICRIQNAAPPASHMIPKLKHIDIRFSFYEGWLWCVIELQEPSLGDIFNNLCCTLIAASRNSKSPFAVISTLLRNLARWQKLLGRASMNLLTTAEQIGICGELLFLKDQMVPRYGIHTSIVSWTAPSGHTQDFMTPNSGAMEIKTRLTSSADIVHISSKWQLWNQDSPLHLVVITIESGNTESCFSLNSLVNEIRNLASSSDQTSEAFNDALLNVGYIYPHTEYDTNKWKFRSTRCYAIDNEFPRLTPISVPSEIESVSYTISLASCEKWKKELSEIFTAY